MSTVTVDAEIACPHCGDTNLQMLEALEGSGTVPKNGFTCDVCDKCFDVHVTVRIDVTASK